jgi:cytoskeletal protein CcmA (bactofilin family)
MKKLRFTIAAFVLLGVVLSVSWARTASAQSFHTGTNIVLNKGGTIDSTVFAAGQTVDISAEVNGDIFCAGQTVTINATVHGDVICAAQTLTINGHVDGDVRLVGQAVTIGATVGGSATIGGQSFTLESAGSIDGDATIGSSSANFNGSVGRDVVAGGENVTIAGTVGRDVTAAGNALVLSSTAAVGGNLEYTSDNSVQRATGATVAGKIVHKTPTHDSNTKYGAVLGFGIAWFIYWLLALGFTALIAALLFPRVLQVVSNRALERPWQALLVGFLANISAPLVVALTAASVIGIPLAFMLGLFWLLVLLTSGLFFAFYIGRLVMRGTQYALLTMLVGVAILLTVSFIPVLGLLALLATLWMGSGMVLMELFRRTPKPVYKLETARAKK